MNQYYHELSAYSGLRRCGATKEFKQIAAGVGMPDSFRAWIGRDGTHHTMGSWWKIQHPERLKRARKEEMQKTYYQSPRAKQAQLENWCVDGLTDFSSFAKENRKLFSDAYKEKYGFPMLVHLLQDFYTDTVWRVLYNFEHQEEKILKTEEKVILGEQDFDGTSNPKTKIPQYHLLDVSKKASSERFRREYKVLNEYASYVLIQALGEEGISYGSKQENQIKYSFQQNYPQEITNQAKGYIKIPEKVKEALRGEEIQLEKEAKQIDEIGIFAITINNNRINWSE